MAKAAFSEMAGSLIGSEVLKIAGEINALLAQGKKITNFTVGDFDPKYFPIPEQLREIIFEAYQLGQTNYPPSSGLQVLREAVAQFYSREFSCQVNADEILVAGGARPLIFTIFSALVELGDTVLYPVPSWNNNHYVHLTRSKGIPLLCKPENGFMPTVDEIRPHLSSARLLCLNSPLNPTGTCISETQLKDICFAVVEENKKREAAGTRPLYLMYDQIYWKLQHKGAPPHVVPNKVCPEIAPYCLYVDGISKYFCGTGLRVGWGWIPKALFSPHSALLGHVGAWAPKPEQLAVAKFLNEPEQINSFVSKTQKEVWARLEPLYLGVQKLKQEGYPVDAVAPAGGIYLSLQVKVPGKKNEEIRKMLLSEAGIAVVPFQAFGDTREEGWFRMSVGAVSVEDVKVSIENLKKFLTHLRR